jgi:3-hydroxyacyl-CoA dehydrogenase
VCGNSADLGFFPPRRHFFSPANVMRPLEVVRGEKTTPDVLATVMALAKKICQIAGVCHGFIGNRMLEQRQIAANKLIMEGAMPWDVDRVSYDFRFPMGPFQLADHAGLNIGWSKETSKGETLRDSSDSRPRAKGAMPRAKRGPLRTGLLRTAA